MPNAHPFSGIASHAPTNESLPFSPVARNFGPYGQTRSIMPMSSLASLPIAWPPQTQTTGGDDSEDRELEEENTDREVTLWGSEYDLSHPSGPRVPWSAKAAAWVNNRIGKALGRVKQRLSVKVDPLPERSRPQSQNLPLQSVPQSSSS